MMQQCTNIEKPMDSYSNSLLFLLFAVFIKDAMWKALAPDTPSQSQIGGKASSRRLNYTGENRNSSSANAAWTGRKSTPVRVAAEKQWIGLVQHRIVEHKPRAQACVWKAGACPKKYLARTVPFNICDFVADVSNNQLWLISGTQEVFLKALNVPSSFCLWFLFQPRQ